MDILILLGLIGLSAVISTAEIGFFAVNETRLRAIAKNGDKRAAMALELRSDPQKLLSTILVGDRQVGTAIPMFATFITLNAYGGKTSFDEAIAVTVGVLTFVLLVSVDVIPKTLAATSFISEGRQTNPFPFHHFPPPARPFIIDDRCLRGRFPPLLIPFLYSVGKGGEYRLESGNP